MDNHVVLWMVLIAVLAICAGWLLGKRYTRHSRKQARARQFRAAYFHDLEDTFVEYMQVKQDVLEELSLSSALSYMLGLVEFHFPDKEHELVRASANELKLAISQAERPDSNNNAALETELHRAFTQFKQAAQPYLAE